MKYMMTSKYLVISILLLSACSIHGADDDVLPIVWQDSQHRPVDNVVRLGATGSGYYFTPIRPVGLVAYEIDGGRRAWVMPAGACEPPSYAEGRVFCPAQRFDAFDATTGTRLWSVDVGSGLALVRGTADVERAYGGTLTEVVALDAVTGALTWRRSFDGPGWVGIRLRSLTLSPEGDLLVAMEALYPPQNSIFSASVIVAVDPATGEERWRYQEGDGTTDQIIGTITFWQNLMLYTDRLRVVAVDRTTRAIRWTYATTPGYLSPLTAPVVADGTAYFSDGYGGVFAVDAATGQRRWESELPGGSWNHAVCGGYLLINLGPMAVLDRRSGRKLGWLVSRDAYVRPTAVEDDRLFATTDRGVYAFDCSR